MSSASQTRFGEVVSFIRQAYHGSSGRLGLHEPRLGGNEKRYLEQCIDSGFVSSIGEFVDRFEAAVAAYTDANCAVVCVNGTNALHLALQLAGVDREDEVLTQSLSFIATANAICYCGAHPVFLDVDRDTMGLSPDAVRRWLAEHAEPRAGSCFNRKSGRRIQACVPMHTFGHPARIEELVALCRDYGLELIEDAAESLGSLYQGRHTGTFGKIGVLSFNGNKIVTTGGGGMLLCQDVQLGRKAKHLTTQAKLPHPWEFVHDSIGYNLRMPNLNAALGCAQMERLEDFLQDKRDLASRYAGFFRQLGMTFVTEPAGCRSNYWLNAVVLNDKAERDEFLEFTNSAGIMTRPVWCPMHKLAMFADCQCGDLSATQWLEERVVNIPSSVRTP